MHPRSVESAKQAAAEAAAELVHDGARVGLGTGSTVAYLLPALAARAFELRCVATSEATETTARALGLDVRSLDEVGELDIAIDGADQIAPDGWLVKGGGAAHTREKVVAAAARRFVVIASADKLVDSLRPPVPLEILRFGAARTLAALQPAALRDVAPSPDGNLIADYLGAVDDPAAVAAWLSATPGVVEHGLFPPQLVSEILVADGARVTSVAGARPWRLIDISVPIRTGMPIYGVHTGTHVDAPLHFFDGGAGAQALPPRAAPAPPPAPPAP